MAIRKAVEEFLKLGRLPESGVATEQDVDNRYAALLAITSPVTDEEAAALSEAFGPDECFGVAWSLLHLIETAPSHPRPRDEVLQRSEWLRDVWTVRAK